ncbi:MAG: GNAT family N-acetyltransferase [Firmicutes bacterium]|nr:GNAT family N-acetyltransferase [Bacillota bacterium]
MYSSIERITAGTRPFVERQIAENWGGPYIVTRGVLHDTRTHPGFVAVENGMIIAYGLFHISGDNCEITVLESLRQGQGVGSALVKAIIKAADDAGCKRVWLITTNDNTRAIRFYQRFGFALKAVHINAVNEARKLKPQIPLTGCDGIPIAHEFEFEIRRFSNESNYD